MKMRGLTTISQCVIAGLTRNLLFPPLAETYSRGHSRRTHRTVSLKYLRKHVLPCAVKMINIAVDVLKSAGGVLVDCRFSAALCWCLLAAALAEMQSGRGVGGIGLFWSLIGGCESI